MRATMNDRPGDQDRIDHDRQCDEQSVHSLTLRAGSDPDAGSGESAHPDTGGPGRQGATVVCEFRDPRASTVLLFRSRSDSPSGTDRAWASEEWSPGPCVRCRTVYLAVVEDLCCARCV